MAASACQENAVVFSNHQGNKLSGTLRLPTTQQAPVVILCHGYAGHRNDCILPRLAAELSTAGLASLRFDYAGNGESEGTFEVGNYWEEVEDIRAAKEHLEQVHGLRVLGVVGKFPQTSAVS
jgi:alpha/beta superfamily hydrolase